MIKLPTSPPINTPIGIAIWALIAIAAIPFVCLGIVGLLFVGILLFAADKIAPNCTNHEANPEI